jgi:1,4-dihydroxy-2-naphthoyl-CoA synthase
MIVVDEIQRSGERCRADTSLHQLGHSCYGGFVSQPRGERIIDCGAPVDAQEALRIGLVNEVVPHAQLMERAEKIARHIVTLPPVAVRMMKEFAVRFGDLPTDQAWQVQNLINTLLIQTTTDGEEGRRAFNEKRSPNFTGALRRRGGAWEESSAEDEWRLDEAYRSGEF